jgi:hypothetical protein
MAKIEKLIGIYTGAALNTPATNVLRMPSITGTITGVYFDASEVTDGDLELAVYEDGVEVTTITVADTTANEDVTGLSFSSTLGKVLSLDLLSPIPTAVPAPPWSLIVTVEVTETHVALIGAQTVAGVKTFSSSPIVPTPSGSTDAANKAYVDSSVAGLSWKQAVRVATTADGTFASAYDNGSTVDGVTLATGDRILIKNQSDQTTNGIYIVAASGAPTRATDADSAAEILQASVYVQEGSTLADTQWVNTTNAPITLGATNIVFAQLSSGGGDITTDDAWVAKGDLIVGTGANTAGVLTVGTNGHIPYADSSEPTGIKWDAPPSGSVPFTAADSTTPAYLDFAEDTDNGSNRVRVIAPASTADVTMTLPAATDTFVGKATTDTFTNKTFDTAGTGNSFSINGVAVTANTGTGDVVRATAPTLTNPKLNLDASQASDDNYAGITIDGRVAASGGLTQWDACYINTSSEIALADANGSSTFPAIGLSVSTVSAAAGATVITHGVVRNDAWTWASIGQPIFLSTTPGGLTQTAPSTSGDKVQVMGIAISADEMLVNPSPDYITIT